MKSHLRRPGLIRRLADAALGMLPDPPAAGDPPFTEVEGIERLEPEERRARLRIWQARFRRGRGDGNG